MLTVDIACSCGGANENCFKCDGWGYIKPTGSDFRLHIPSARARQKLPLARDRQKTLVTHGRQDRHLTSCPYCPPKLNVKVKNLARHLRKMHPVQDDGGGKAAATALVSASTASQVRATQSVGSNKHLLPADSALCPFCPSTVKIKNLPRHLREIHPGRDAGISGRTAATALDPTSNSWSVQAAESIDNDKWRLPNDMVLCPYCPANVKHINLVRHLRKTHPGRDADARSMTAAKVLAATSIAMSLHPLQRVDNASRQQIGRGDALDKARSYAHAFRDHGQFGSHPAHDDFSDEGFA